MTSWRRQTQIAALMVTGSLLSAACTGTTAETETVISTPITTTSTTPDSDDDSNSNSNEAPPMTTEPANTSTSTSASTPASSDEVDDDPCRRLTDFADEGESRWAVVDDGVMGGRSSGSIDISDSTMRFSGTVVTDGGGFTSVRLRLDGGEMVGTNRLSMRLRADDRVYGVTLEDDAEVGQRSVSHRADLETTGDVDADGWTVVSLDYAQLAPSVFGRSVDAPPFNPDAAREVGIIIADGIDGDFSLDVDWVDVCE